MATVFCQKWIESERGWGMRDDGVSLHLTEADLTAFIKEYWAAMPKEVPDEYARPDGLPKRIELDKRTKLYKSLAKSPQGIWHYGEVKC
jgi:hypothetical protein